MLVVAFDLLSLFIMVLEQAAATAESLSSQLVCARTFSAFGVCYRVARRVLQAVGLSLDRDDLGIVHQSIDTGDDTGCIGEHLGPFRERLVG
jgi:hypothetical protein